MVISGVSSALGSAMNTSAASGVGGNTGIKFDLIGKNGATGTPGETPGSSSFGDMVMRSKRPRAS
jgi:hypothetical protein